MDQAAKAKLEEKRAKAFQESAREDLEEFLSCHSQVCNMMDRTLGQLTELLAISLDLDRKSEQGYNRRFNLGRRLRTKEIMKTVATAHSQLNRVKTNTKAGGPIHRDAVLAEINSPPVFE